MMLIANIPGFKISWRFLVGLFLFNQESREYFLFAAKLQRETLE